MFEKEAKERAEEIEAKQTLGVYDNDEDFARDEGWNDGYVSGYEEGFQNGAEFGYNKAKEEAMMKLKDEGIVKPLKDSILRNERLSSQEQQELCAWIECAVDFGENLDECVKELEEANKAKEELENKNAELKEENEKSNVLLSDIIEAFTSRSYNDDFEMAQAGREIYELFYGGKDPKEVFHNAEVPKCSRQLLKEAKDLIRNLLRVTYGEGWNYDLGWKVKAEDFIKPKENE